MGLDLHSFLENHKGEYLEINKPVKLDQVGALVAQANNTIVLSASAAGLRVQASSSIITPFSVTSALAAGFPSSADLASAAKTGMAIARTANDSPVTTGNPRFIHPSLSTFPELHGPDCFTDRNFDRTERL